MARFNQELVRQQRLATRQRNASRQPTQESTVSQRERQQLTSKQYGTALSVLDREIDARESYLRSMGLSGTSSGYGGTTSEYQRQRIDKNRAWLEDALQKRAALREDAAYYGVSYRTSVAYTGEGKVQGGTPQENKQIRQAQALSFQQSKSQTPKGAVASAVVNGQPGVLVNDERAAFLASPGFMEFSARARTADTQKTVLGANRIGLTVSGQGSVSSSRATQRDITLDRPYPYSSAIGFSTDEGYTEILSKPTLPKKTLRQESRDFLRFSTDIYDEDKRSRMDTTDIGSGIVRYGGVLLEEGGTRLEKFTPSSRVAQNGPFNPPVLIGNLGLVLREQGSYARESPRAFVATNIVSFGAAGLLGKGAGFVESKIASGRVGQFVTKYPKLKNIGLGGISSSTSTRSFSQALSFRKGTQIAGGVFLVSDLGIRGYTGGKEAIAREALPLALGGAGFSRGFGASRAVRVTSFESPRTYRFTQLSGASPDFFTVKGVGRASMKLTAGDTMLQTYPRVDLLVNPKQSINVGTARRINPGQTDIRIISKISSPFGSTKETFKGVIVDKKYTADYDLLAVTKGGGRSRVTFESFTSRPSVRLREDGVTTQYSFFRNQVYMGSDTPRITRVSEGVTRQDYFARGRVALEREYFSEGAGFSARGKPYLRDTGITIYPGYGVTRGTTTSRGGVVLRYPGVSRGVSLLSERGLFKEGFFVPRARRAIDITREVDVFPRRITKLYSGVPELEFKYTARPSTRSASEFFPLENVRAPKVDSVLNPNLAGFPVSRLRVSTPRFAIGSSVLFGKKGSVFAQNAVTRLSQPQKNAQTPVYKFRELVVQDQPQLFSPRVPTTQLRVLEDPKVPVPVFTPFSPRVTTPRSPSVPGWLGGFNLGGRGRGGYSRRSRAYRPSRTIAEVTFNLGGELAKSVPGGYTGLELTRSYARKRKTRRGRKK